MMIEKVLIFNDWQEAAAKLQPPHPEAGIIAQRMAFEATTRNLSKVTFIEKPAALIVGNTVIKTRLDRNRELVAREEARKAQGEINKLKPIWHSRSFDNLEQVASTELKPGQLFSIEKRKSDGTIKVITTYTDEKRGMWIVTNHPGLKSFHAGQYPTVLRIKPDAEPVVATTPEPPKPSLLRALEIMVNGPEQSQIITFDPPAIVELTADDFRNGRVTAEQAHTAFETGKIGVVEYNNLLDLIQFQRNPAWFASVIGGENATAG